MVLPPLCDGLNWTLSFWCLKVPAITFGYNRRMELTHRFTWPTVGDLSDASKFASRESCWRRLHARLKAETLFPHIRLFASIFESQNVERCGISLDYLGRGTILSCREDAHDMFHYITSSYHHLGDEGSSSFTLKRHYQTVEQAMAMHLGSSKVTTLIWIEIVVSWAFVQLFWHALAASLRANLK